MRSAFASLTTLACLAPLVGCQSQRAGLPKRCEPPLSRGVTYAFAVHVFVSDSVAGRTPSASASDGGIVVRVRDGRFTKTETALADGLGPSLHFPFAVERPGTYTVEVDVPGYVPWRVERVRVTREGCTLKSANLHARLIRAPGR
jgi:hypothetical protein